MGSVKYENCHDKRTESQRFYLSYRKMLADKLAEKIRRNYGHVKPGLKTKAYFEVMRKLVKSGWNEVDVAYWKEHGWTEKARPWK